MSTFEDGQQQQQEQEQTPSPQTPLRQTNEASTNNNSIMGKVKLRVSSIFPDSLSKWFSPTTEGGAARGGDNSELSPSSLQQQQQQQQQNGSALTIKRKRSRRRIELEADDAPDVIIDDGIDAQDLNDEEVQLADNIAEHDLAAEDEQTRRNEYNVNLLRKRQMAVARDVNDDDEDDDDDLEEEEDEEQDQDDVHMYQPNRNALGFKMAKPNNNAAAQQPPMKRTRLEQSETPFSPQLNAQRRRPQLHASTPAVGDAGLRSHAPPNRLTHLNLYGHLRQREPAFNFLAAGSSSEAAVATSGDLPMSSRRSLNIPPMTERRDTTTSTTMLPSYKRQSLLGGQRGLNWRTCSPISEEYHYERQQAHQQQQQQQTTIMRQETNNNNNNNNINKPGAGTDSHSECESNESHAGLRTHNNNNNNSNLLFYGNLQSRKSVFNANATTPTPPHHNSTLSLNSLNNRRRFNASIYGSTSALSDSRLLSSSVSSTMSGSPFYQGPTAFGGSSANNRYFSQGNLAIINSGGSSPAPSNSDSISVSSARISHQYSMKPIEMRPKQPTSGDGDGAATAAAAGLSQTAQRILNLLENHSTPLMDAKKMGSTLREHQQQRTSRHATKPYSYPTAYGGYNHSFQSRNNTLDLDKDISRTNNNSSKLLVPTMLQLLERRRLQRVTPSTRQLIDAKQQQLQLKQKQQQQPRTTTATIAPAAAAATTTAATTAAAAPAVNTTVSASPLYSSSSFAPVSASGSGGSHTNKMRSRLSHQTRKDVRTLDDELPPAPYNLPDIRFPSMASEPKFDLTFVSTSKPTTAAATTVATTTSLSATVGSKTAATTATSRNSVDYSSSSSNNNKAKSKSNNIYEFDAPLPLNCMKTTDNSLPHKRIKHNFQFVPPTPLDVQQQQQQQQQQPEKELQLNGDKSLITSGSVLDVLLPKKSTAAATTTVATDATTTTASVAATTSGFAGFADRFKRPAGNWECDACMLSNKADATKCVACETPKATAKVFTAAATTTTAAAAATPTTAATVGGFAGFADRFKKPAGNWECDACMLSNKMDASKCIACETPRKAAAAAATTTTTGNNSLWPTTGGFGDAFKPKANTWSCDTCMVTNESSANSCVACQTPNPKANNSSSGNTATVAATTTTTSNFKFGFANNATTAAAPKPDAGFQKLIAAQKSSSWTCEACTAQNDVARNKCICCEQLKPGATAAVEAAANTSAVPKFMFGFGNSATTTTSAAAATTTGATTTTATVATAAQFTFGFAAGKDVADKPETTTTTATTTLNTSATTSGFKFGAASTPVSKSVAFNLGEPQTQKQQQHPPPQQQQQQSAEAADTTAPVSSKAPATSSIGLGLFTAAATKPEATAANPTATFAFGSSNKSTTTTTAAAATTATATEAGNKLFGFGSFTATSTMSSSSGSSSTTTSSSNNNSSSNSSKPAAATFSFGSSNMQQQQQQQPAVTTAAAATTTTPSTLFGQQMPLFAAATTAVATTTTTTTSTSIAPAAFAFGSQTNAAAATTTASSSNNTSNFFFGSPATAAATTTSAAIATTPVVSAASNNMNLFSSNPLAKSITSSSNTAAAPNTTPMFSFGSAASNNSTFSFGSKPAAATTTASGSNFNWSTPAAAAPTNQFASFGSVASAATATTSTGNAAVSSPFSMSVAQPNAVPGGASSGASGGGHSALFGYVSNPFNSSNNATATPAAPLANIFNSSSSSINSNKPSTTTVAAATTTTIAKPVFNFGAVTAPATQSAAGVFNFGAGSTNPGGTSKPAFNFTATGTAPQAAAFNFTGTAGTAAASTSGGNDLYPTPERLFQFGAAASTSDNVAAVGGGAGSSSSSSSIVPAAGQLFNFTGSAQQMQSTPNAAPFQFNAGAPAPAANIFAFNPPNAGNNNMQNPRRKIRAPMRRLPPR